VAKEEEIASKHRINELRGKNDIYYRRINTALGKRKMPQECSWNTRKKLISMWKRNTKQIF